MSGHGSSVLHRVKGDEALPALVERVRGIHAAGGKALIVSALRPANGLLHFLGNQEGIDLERIGLIDATGDPASQSQDRPGDNILFVESPAQMETILVRIDRLLRRMGSGVGVIVHTLDAFALYAPQHQVFEFANCLLHNLCPKGSDVEMLCVCTEASESMREKLEALVDMTVSGTD